jgi:hypothetical protein
MARDFFDLARAVLEETLGKSDQKTRIAAHNLALTKSQL